MYFPTVQYKSELVSGFQKKIRGDMLVLNDHISKAMSELIDLSVLPSEKVYSFSFRSN